MNTIYYYFIVDTSDNSRGAKNNYLLMRAIEILKSKHAYGICLRIIEFNEGSKIGESCDPYKFSSFDLKWIEGTKTRSDLGSALELLLNDLQITVVHKEEYIAPMIIFLCWNVASDDYKSALNTIKECSSVYNNAVKIAIGDFRDESIKNMLLEITETSELLIQFEDGLFYEGMYHYSLLEHILNLTKLVEEEQNHRKRMSRSSNPTVLQNSIYEDSSINQGNENSLQTIDENIDWGDDELNDDGGW